MQLEWNLTVGSYLTRQDFIFGVPDCLAFHMINNCQDFANSNGHSSYVLITVHSRHDTNLIGPLRVKKKRGGWRLYLHLKCFELTELVETLNHKKTCLFDSCCMTPTPVADLIKVPSELHVKSDTLNISRGRGGPASACCSPPKYDLVRETPTCSASQRPEAWISQADGSSVTSQGHAPHIR